MVIARNSYYEYFITLSIKGFSESQLCLLKALIDSQ